MFSSQKTGNIIIIAIYQDTRTGIFRHALPQRKMLFR